MEKSDPSPETGGADGLRKERGTEARRRSGLPLDAELLAEARKRGFEHQQNNSGGIDNNAQQLECHNSLRTRVKCHCQANQYGNHRHSSSRNTTEDTKQNSSRKQKLLKGKTILQWSAGQQWGKFCSYFKPEE